MVTWPANMPPPARAFVSRQVELREKLRWAPLNSRRRQKLEAELAKIVLEELRRETEPPGRDDADADQSAGPDEQWWQQW